MMNGGSDHSSPPGGAGDGVDGTTKSGGPGLPLRPAVKKPEDTARTSTSVSRPNTISNRSVSWGEDPKTAAAQGVQAAQSAPLSPTMSPAGSNNNSNKKQHPLLAPHHSPTISMLTPPDLTTNSELSSKIDLLDVMQNNPLESEAESYILRAIETREGTTKEEDLPRPSLLGNVPDHAKEVFKTSETANTADGDQQQEANRNRTFSSASNAPASKRTVHSTAHKRKPVHTRGKSTMEETLAGLTGQLEGVHKQEQKRFGLANITAQMLARDKARMDDPNAGSGDTFAQAANIMLRKNAASKQASATATTTGNKHWGVLKTAVNAANTDGVAASTTSAGGEAAAATGGGASNKWSKLRASVVSGAEEEQIPARPKADPKANWGKLRMAVNTAAAMSKKDDDAPQPEEDPELGRSENEDDFADEDDTYYDGDDEVAEAKHRNRLQKAFDASFIGDLSVFAKQRRKEFFAYLRMIFFAVFPGIGLACILFYLAGNPPTGFVDQGLSVEGIKFDKNGELIPADQASYSWWILFIGVRQVAALSLAKLFQVLFIDFFCLNTRIMTRMCGQLITLLIVQSRGWPFLAVTWALINFGLNYGSSRFHKHWAYWQDALDVFNETNPSGGVPDNDWYRTLLIIAISWGCAVAVKRLWLGLHLGRKTYANYAEDLARTMQKIVLLCEVAALGRELEQDVGGGLPPVDAFGISREDFESMLHMYDDDHGNDAASISSRSLASGKVSRTSKPLVSPKELNVTGSFTDRHKSVINELLGAWEEPDHDVGIEENVTISGILQFRQSLQYLENKFFFSIAWGNVGTREKMIISSQEVYKRLVSRSPKRSLLSFEVLALCCLQDDGETLDLEKMKRLIKLLRPDRDGKLTMLDFVKSVDAVYKEAKLLRASVKNSEMIDRAFERVINIGFYAVLFLVTLPQLGIDPLDLFLSLSSIIVGFAFMIGPAASKMFEGWLFILVRRPYDIGDRIHINVPNSDPGLHGSASWFVRDVDLFTTTVVYAATGEKATLNNGYLASFRLINLARSPNPVMFVHIKFAVDTPLSKIQIFEEAVRKFVKSRPREWAQVLGFRPSNIMQEQGYVEYMVILQHRETWQNVGAMLVSKAEVQSFCLELTKKLDMRYVQPPMPVEISMHQTATENESVVARFQSMAETAGDDVAALFNRPPSS